MASAAIASLLAVAAAGGGYADAAPRAPIRACEAPVEDAGSRPVARPTDLNLGPIRLAGAKGHADPGPLQIAWRPRDKVYAVKAGASVTTNRDVTLSIAPESRSVAKLTYLRTPRSAVRFKACKDRNGNRSAFAGGIQVKELACVTLEAWVPRRAKPYRATISMGAGATCPAR